MAANASRVYVVSMTRVSVSGAITLLQIKMGATVPGECLRVSCDESSSTTSTQQPAQVNRKSAAGTVTSFTPVAHGPTTDPAASAVGGTAATGTNASAEGTDSNILKQGVWNYLNGFLWVPKTVEQAFIDAASIIGLKLPIAPGSAVTLTADFLFEEKA
jgi:hypothetical protein